MRGHPLPRLVLLALAGALSPGAAVAQDASPEGPPAFVPLESAAAAASLRAAAALAGEGKAEAAAAAYQAVADGPLRDRLAPLEDDPDTLEQARERALREVSRDPALLQAWRARFEPVAERLLAGDSPALREAFDRFPLAAAGARAGLALAREAHRRGRPEEALGILDRLSDLRPGGAAAVPAGEALLAAAAAADAGDGDLLERAAAAPSLRGDLPGPGGLPLAEFLARCRERAAAAAPPAGPRGRLLLRWRWSPEEAGEPVPPEVSAVLPVYPTELPPRPDRLAAVREGLVYWADPLRVTALDLATGEPRAFSTPVAARPRDAVPSLDHLGETFAPAADGEGIVAALDDPDPGPLGRRSGALHLFDPSLRLLVRRGGDGDVEHPDLARRFVFHGRPLLLGDRVVVSATESAARNSTGDVRTHLLCFRRRDLEPLWDAFLSYGSGIHVSDVAPAGSPVHRHGRIYVATHTGLEACVDARTGAVLWAHRYRTPEMAPTPRLANRADMTGAPVLWYECPPAFSGDRVAFAPRDSYFVEFLRQRPLPGSGRVLLEEHKRPRLDRSDLTALWVVGGPAGTFFLAGQSSGREEPPLHQRDVDPAADSQVPWRGPLLEPTVAGLPVRTRDSLYAITEKALYRIPWPGRDGEIEVLAALPPATPKEPRPRAGNLLVLPDAILSVSDEGILCFAPAPPTTPK